MDILIRKEIFKKANTVAVGWGKKIINGVNTGQDAIIVSVTKKRRTINLSKKDLVPDEIDGIPTDVIQTGVIRAFEIKPDLKAESDPTGKFRPAPGGVSVGHHLITAGTLGCYVQRNDDWYILSNNHVLANSNNAAIGDAILQPGAHDGGVNPADRITSLADFIPVKMIGLPSECNIAGIITKICNAMAWIVGSDTRLNAVSYEENENLVDAAIAGPMNTIDMTKNILNIGIPDGISFADVGDKIKKSGRTTGYTEDEVTQIDVDVNVQYGTGQIALFVDQFMAGPMSAPGDSGSVILNSDNHLIGLLFAGSEDITIASQISNVFELLDVHL